MDANSIIIRPVISEKTTELMEQNKYVFRVPVKANKMQIKQAIKKIFNVQPEKVNVMAGGLAIGHPLGATGARLVGTLARILNKKCGRWGCANACVGGGQGVATIIEREEYE